MKNLLIVIGVVAAALIIYFLVTSENFDKALNSLVSQNNSEVEPGRSTGAPSANDSGTFTLDKKYSSVNMIYASKAKTDTWDMLIQSGNIIVTSGNIDNGSVVMSMNDLKRTGLTFDTTAYPEATFAIKAIVFDQASSTTDNLVFRTDGELTINGKKNPLSFKSKYSFEDGGVYISGTATPDWKLWGIIVPSDDSMTMDISLYAVK